MEVAATEQDKVRRQAEEPKQMAVVATQALQPEVWAIKWGKPRQGQIEQEICIATTAERQITWRTSART
jgi:hypothetical protein